jgi:hypothetical protein
MTNPRDRAPPGAAVSAQLFGTGVEGKDLAMMNLY